MNRVLIIDEDPSLAQAIATRLFEEGIRAEIYQNGEVVFDRLPRSMPVDLIVLGSTHPYVESIQLYRRIRRDLTCPIIYIHDPYHNAQIKRMPEIDQNDFFTKPVSAEVIFQRMWKHLLDRGQTPSEDIQTIERLSIDRLKNRAFFNGQQIRLSVREFQLLSYLAENIGKTVTRDQIIDTLWKNEGQTSTNVTVYVKNLRGKFDPDSRFIKTVWGMGYRFTDPTQDYI